MHALRQRQKKSKQKKQQKTKPKRKREQPKQDCERMQSMQQQKGLMMVQARVSLERWVHQAVVRRVRTKEAMIGRGEKRQRMKTQREKKVKQMRWKRQKAWFWTTERWS